jgi:hypothetical protein
MTQFNQDPPTDPAVRAVITKMSHLPIDPHGEKTDVVGISDLLVELFTVLNSEDVGEVVASAVEEGIFTQEQGGEILGISVWSGETNGADLQPTVERWLEEPNSPIRVGLALAQGIFPFSSAEHMNEVLLRVSSRFPQYSAVCSEIVRRRHEQGT